MQGVALRDRVGSSPAQLIAGAVAIGIAYVATRFLFIDRFPSFLDEGTYAAFSNRAAHATKDLFYSFTIGREPLMFWLGIPPIKLGVNPLVSVRLVSAAAGLLTLVFVGLLARRLGGAAAGLTAAALCVLLPLLPRPRRHRDHRADGHPGDGGRALPAGGARAAPGSARGRAARARAGRRGAHQGEHQARPRPRPAQPALLRLERPRPVAAAEALARRHRHRGRDGRRGDPVAPRLLALPALREGARRPAALHRPAARRRAAPSVRRARQDLGRLPTRVRRLRDDSAARRRAGGGDRRVASAAPADRAAARLDPAAAGRVDAVLDAALPTPRHVRDAGGHRPDGVCAGGGRPLDAHRHGTAHGGARVRGGRRRPAHARPPARRARARPPRHGALPR